MPRYLPVNTNDLHEISMKTARGSDLKKYVIFSLITIIFLSGCTYYKIKSKSKPTVDLNKYEKIYLGYLDLGEDRWATYGYATEKEWLDIIRRVNKSALPSYFREVFEEKTIVMAKKPGEAPPKDCLIINFQNANFLYSDDQLFVTIDFIDGATSRNLATYSAYIKAWRGGGWVVWSFESRVVNSIRNLAYFVKERIF